MPRKLTYEFVKDYFDATKYILVSTEYFGCEKKLQYICPDHPDKELWISFHSFQSGQGCPYCYGNVKYTYLEVKERFSKRGYILISKEYKGKHFKLQYQCPYHPDKELWMTFHALDGGSGCPYCSKKAKPSLEERELEFKLRGYVLNTKEYTNQNTKLNFTCPKHPDKELWITWDNFKNQKQGCKYCALENQMGENNWNYKGAITSLTQNLRNKIDSSNLNKGKKWTKDKKLRDNCTCQISGKTGCKLNVHHLYNFSAIRDRALDELGFRNRVYKKMSSFTDIEFNSILKLVIQYNDEVDGITLEEEVHKLFHKTYGRTYNTPEQMEEFKQRYQAGELTIE